MVNSPQAIGTTRRVAIGNSCDETKEEEDEKEGEDDNEPWWTNCKEAYEQCKADVSCNGGMDEAEQQGTCVLSLSVFRPC